MINDKDLRYLLSRIDRVLTLKDIEECIELMKEIVLDNDSVTPEIKKQYLFVYIQCQQLLSLYIAKEIKVKRRLVLKNRFLSFMRSKKK